MGVKNSESSSQAARHVVRASRGRLSGVMVACVFSVGCAEWSDAVVAPESFRRSYIQLHECRPSVHPEADYVISWLSPNAREIWDAWTSGDEEVEFEVGTVSVKAQYSDSSCKNLESYTLKEKVEEDPSGELGGWKWQYINDAGECINCNGGIGCSGCHSLCSTGPDYFCNSPEAINDESN